MERPGGFPLVSLFILVALCGILLGMVVPLGREIDRDQVALPDVLAASFFGMLILSFIGMLVSLYVHRRLSGILVGAIVGGFLGILAGPVCLVPRESFSHLLVVGLAGSIALLGIAAGSRFISGRAESAPRRDKPGGGGGW